MNVTDSSKIIQSETLATVTAGRTASAQPAVTKALVDTDKVTLSSEAIKKLADEVNNGGGTEPPADLNNGGGTEPPAEPNNGGGTEPPAQAKARNGGGSEPPAIP